MSSQARAEATVTPRSPSVARLTAEFVRRNQNVVLMMTAWAAGAAVLATRIDQGWMNHDDGSLAQSAQRVLTGELPHRDFAELYTGGLAFIDAGVFWLFGENMGWLRIPLYVAFLGFVPCFYAVARRFLPPIGAFVATLFAITWSVPAYPAPMPSWYLLFLSVFGIYAALRFFETERTLWLGLAGLAGGVSVCIKITGVWYVIAVLLALALAHERRVGLRAGRQPSFPFVVIALAAVSILLVGDVFRPRMGAPAIASLVLPVAVTCVGVIVLAMRRVSADVASTSLARQVTTLAIGVLTPVAVLLLPYVATGSVGILSRGCWSLLRCGSTLHTGPCHRRSLSCGPFP